MEKVHAFLPPSGAKAWVKCAMWPTMNRRYPQARSQDAEEGKAAHWVFEKSYAGEPPDVGDLAPNEIQVTEEMLEGADLMIETIRRMIPDESTVHVELPVEIRAVSNECDGTPDVWAYDWLNKKLTVIDYKFGHGFIDEFENLQCILYSIGVLESLTVLDLEITVEITIVQPRCYGKGSPVRTWVTSASELRNRILVLQQASKAALSENPVATTNSECRNCPGRHSCKALQIAAYNDAEFSAQGEPFELSPVAASLELRMLERALARLDARVEALRESVLTYARQGADTPYHKVDATPGRLAWSIPEDQVIAMGELMGVNLAKKSVITPTQAKKSGIDETVINAYTIKQQGQLKLVSNNPQDAKKVFGSNT